MAKEEQFPGFQSPNYTPVPDELFDILLPTLKEAELKVLLYITRRTFGFKKNSDNISLKQMVEGIRTRDGRIVDRGAGISKPATTKAVRSLIQKGIITATRNRSAEKGDEPTTYTLRFKEDTVLKKLTRGDIQTLHGGVKIFNPQETVLQETDNVNVGETLLNDKEAEEEALIDELVAQLGDRNHQSRKTYRQIIRTLGPSIVWRLLGNTKEASRDGLIETTKAAYFTGMAKKVAQGQGVELGFRSTNSRKSSGQQKETAKGCGRLR